MMSYKSKLGQSTLEYTVVWGAIVIAILAFAYAKLGGETGGIVKILGNANNVIGEAGTKFDSDVDTSTSPATPPTTPAPSGGRL